LDGKGNVTNCLASKDSRPVQNKAGDTQDTKGGPKFSEIVGKLELCIGYTT